MITHPLIHRTLLAVSPRCSNDVGLFSYNGMWSVLSTYVDAQGKSWLLAPFYGPAARDTAPRFKKNHGPSVNGVLMAFTVEGPTDKPTLQPQWMSADLDLPGVAVVAKDVILILANGDRGSTLIPGAGGRGGGGRGGGGARGGAALGPGGTPSVMNPNLKSVDRPWQPIDRKLADTVSSYWANFASKGDPNGRGLPAWPAYDATSDVTLGSNDTIGPHPRPDGNRLDFFERVGEAAVSPLTDCGRGPEQTKSPVSGLWPHGRCFA
jgi:hypothetical protein